MFFFLYWINVYTQNVTYFSYSTDTYTHTHMLAITNFLSLNTTSYNKEQYQIKSTRFFHIASAPNAYTPPTPQPNTIEWKNIAHSYTLNIAVVYIELHLLLLLLLVLFPACLRVECIRVFAYMVFVVCVCVCIYIIRTIRIISSFIFRLNSPMYRAAQ